MSDPRQDARANDPVVEITGTKVPSPAPEEVPLEDDGVEATGGVRGGHSHSTNRGQPSDGLDRGVDPEHLRSPSQGARPES